MKLKSERGFSFVWLVVILAAIGVAVLGYFLLQSSADEDDSTNTQKTSVEQQEIVDESSNSTNSQEAVDEDEEEIATGTVITTGDSDYGTMLFNDKGQAIYIWELEETTEAECYGDCAVAWPPVLTDGAPRATGSVSDELLGTTERTDGNVQVTYNGHPLYYYAHEGPGEVLCHNVPTHGGLWWVIQPSGVRAE